MLERLARALRPPTQADVSPRVIEVAGDDSAQDVYLDAAARLLDAQVKANEVLDARAANAFAIGGTILPIAFGLLSVNNREFPLLSEFFLFLAVGAYVVLLVCSYLVGNRTQHFEYRPDIPTLRAHTQVFGPEEVRVWVALEYEASSEANKRMLSRKTRYVASAFAALYAESLFLSVAAVLSLVLA